MFGVVDAQKERKVVGGGCLVVMEMKCGVRNVIFQVRTSFMNFGVASGTMTPLLQFGWTVGLDCGGGLLAPANCFLAQGPTLPK
jgi:hypothetical protein